VHFVPVVTDAGFASDAHVQTVANGEQANTNRPQKIAAVCLCRMLAEAGKYKSGFCKQERAMTEWKQ
jgi:hypothetical protein